MQLSKNHAQQLDFSLTLLTVLKIQALASAPLCAL
jgi:hypothetical protein